MSYQYKESRVAVAGTSRRIALDPLEFQGQQITSLDQGDKIEFTVFNEDGSLFQETVAAVYEQIAETVRNEPVIAWSGLVNVGAIAQTLKIVWRVEIQGASDTFSDYITVQQSPLAGRTTGIVADSVII